MQTTTTMPAPARASTNASYNDRDACWYERQGVRCTNRAWGGTLVCRQHMRQGLRRFLAERGAEGDALEQRVDEAMRNLDGQERARVSQVRDPGRTLKTSRPHRSPVTPSPAARPRSWPTTPPCERGS